MIFANLVSDVVHEIGPHGSEELARQRSVMNLLILLLLISSFAVRFAFDLFCAYVVHV